MRQYLTRQVIMAFAIIGLVVAILLVGPAACRKWNSERAQARLDAAQGEAARNSAGDAVGTVAGAGEREAASEALSRENDKEIHNAPGADQRVNSGVDAAGRRSLCRREAYRDSERCRMLRAPAG